MPGLAAVQRGLLNAAIDSARPGGIVAYVTCSPHLAETRDVVTAVAGRRGDVTILDAPAVLADRAVVIRRHLEQAYPVTRRTRVTYSGRGYSAGYAQGQRADIGNARLGRTRALNRA